MRFREVLINEGKEELPYLCFNILTVWWVEPCNVSLMVSTPGEDSYMEQTGMLVGNFEFNPKGDHLGVA